MHFLSEKCEEQFDRLLSKISQADPVADNIYLTMALKRFEKVLNAMSFVRRESEAINPFALIESQNKAVSLSPLHTYDDEPIYLSRLFDFNEHATE